MRSTSQAMSATTSGYSSGAPATCETGPPSSPHATFPATILAQIEEARAAVRAAAARTTLDRLQEDFPEVVGGVRVVTGEYLIHLVSHFAFHLGQLDYHRRVVTGQTRGMDAVRAAELSTARPVPD